jgi:ABC-type long-subunit fatty acid transport system fused permease/ATPase subunit
VREDRRYAIFPEYFDSNIQRIAYSQNFWEEYLGEYDNVHIHTVYDNAGLGRGFGSFASASYTTALGPKMDKRALMFVSLYNNKAYIIECSAEQSSYHKWHNSFLSVVKSVDFRKEVNEAKNGYYRNFYGNMMSIRGPRKIDIDIY